MNYKLLNRMTAGIVFFISFIQFILTVQPSVSFWDTGEFIAAGYSLQVPHPPGAPLFLLIGRIFSMLPLGLNTALQVNLISVISSALSVLLLYLVAVKLIENYRGKTPQTMFEAIITFLAAAIGALSFSFSDTFWFNGVEAEVYAASTFLFALVVWLMMIWNEKADEIDNEKYVIMIAYVIGLSIGVHLMSVLAIVPVVMTILFRKYVVDEEVSRKSALIFLGHAALLLVVALFMWGKETGSTPPTPEVYKEFDRTFVVTMGVLSVIIMGIFYKVIFNRSSFYIPIIIGGIALFVTYPGVVKLVPGLIVFIGHNDVAIAIVVLIALLSVFGFAMYWSAKNNQPTLNLIFTSMLFVILGFTTYAMVIIRANQQPPMNENDPDTFTELVSYLNREQYGDFPQFKRRFTNEPHQQGVFQNYNSDLDFFWNYQMDHMFNRYLFWNYIGREGWNQDQGVDPKQLFAIPFLLGLFGLFHHYRRDWKMASVFLVMFIFMGYLTAFYQNQQQPQPRERDYFYVGAYFVFSIWIALGVKGLVELIFESIQNISTAKIISYAIILISIIFVPVNMARTNWFTHDRSKNWVPWDYSYNLLQSAAPNAILFTNGDNDTFPLWYLQDVEGVRRDIRVVNLSLLNTDWYIKQLKNTEPYGAKKVSISFTDEQIERLGPAQWQTKKLRLPVSQNVIEDFRKQGIDKYGMLDSNVVNNGYLEFTMEGPLRFGEVRAVRVQDIMIKDIVEQNKWQRPIYFAVTTPEDSQIGLNDYTIMEGIAQRLVPFKRKANEEFVNAEVMRKQLLEENPDFSKTYQPGFKFRGLNDRNIFFDESHQRLSQNYRTAFLRLALHYLYNEKNNEMTLKILDEMERKIPSEVFEMPFSLMFNLSSIYNTVGGTKQYQQLAKKLEKTAWQMIENNPRDVQGFFNPYRILIQIYDEQGRYDKVVEVFERLKTVFPDDAGIESELQRYRSMMQNRTPQNSDTAK